jgi:hypothetical protein
MPQPMKSPYDHPKRRYPSPLPGVYYPHTHDPGALLALIVHRVRASVVERQAWWVATLCVLVPALLAVIPGVLGDYGVAGAWCVRLLTSLRGQAGNPCSSIAPWGAGASHPLSYVRDTACTFS